MSARKEHSKLAQAAFWRRLSSVNEKREPKLPLLLARLLDRLPPFTVDQVACHP